MQTGRPFSPNRYRISPDGLSATLFLNHDKETVVSIEDLAEVLKEHWAAKKAANGPGFYAYTRLRGVRKWKTLHRFILELRGVAAPDHIDHADRDQLNNQFSNLRPATPSQNTSNRPYRNRTTGYRGVSLKKYPTRQMFQAEIHGPQGRQYLGLYSSAEEAARVYDCAAKVRFGEFATLNFSN